MRNNINNKIKKEGFALVGDFSRVKVRINNNKNNIINSSFKLLIILIAALLILLLVPSTFALPSTIYSPNGIAIAQVSEDGTIIYAGDGTEFLILNDSNGNIIYKEVVDDSGNLIKEEGTQPKDLQRRIDKETGLYWYAYDSTTKTYLQATGIFGMEVVNGVTDNIAKGALYLIYMSLPSKEQEFLAPSVNAIAEEHVKSAPVVSEIGILGSSAGLADKIWAGSRLVGYSAGGAAFSLSKIGYNPTVWGGGGCVGGHGCAAPVADFYVTPGGVAIPSMGASIEEIFPIGTSTVRSVKGSPFIKGNKLYDARVVELGRGGGLESNVRTLLRDQYNLCKRPPGSLLISEKLAVNEPGFDAVLLTVEQGVPKLIIVEAKDIKGYLKPSSFTALKNLQKNLNRFERDMQGPYYFTEVRDAIQNARTGNYKCIVFIGPDTIVTGRTMLELEKYNIEPLGGYIKVK